MVSDLEDVFVARRLMMVVMQFDCLAVLWRHFRFASASGAFELILAICVPTVSIVPHMLPLSAITGEDAGSKSSCWQCHPAFR